AHCVPPFPGRPSTSLEGAPVPNHSSQHGSTPIDLAVEAYFYYYPLVENLRQVRRYVEHGVGQNPAAPYNVFSHARHLATDKDTFGPVDRSHWAIE
ncbi:hypothetical protein ACC691_37425, partial [Rhizobium johnstonii]|uniref:hypothetical protein n=1 Tax=Rhizobium johnstonii TaxID=3019933 RepID=UPI003F96D668